MYTMKICIYIYICFCYRENGFKFVRLDGSMRNNQRVSAIEAFSDENPGAPTIMLLSLKAGGVGINLTAASRLFLMEPVCAGFTIQGLLQDLTKLGFHLEKCWNI